MTSTHQTAETFIHELRYPGALPMHFDGRSANPVGFAFAGAATIDALVALDGHQECKGHASVALVPTLFAELGSDDCAMDAILCHLIVDEEIAIRSGLSLHTTAPDYHSSGAWNALGCTALLAGCGGRRRNRPGKLWASRNILGRVPR